MRMKSRGNFQRPGRGSCHTVVEDGGRVTSLVPAHSSHTYCSCCLVREVGQLVGEGLPQPFSDSGNSESCTVSSNDLGASKFFVRSEGLALPSCLGGKW